MKIQWLTVASFKIEGKDSMRTVEGGRFMGTPLDASRSRVSLTCRKMGKSIAQLRKIKINLNQAAKSIRMKNCEMKREKDATRKETNRKRIDGRNEAAHPQEPGDASVHFWRLRQVPNRRCSHPLHAHVRRGHPVDE